MISPVQLPQFLLSLWTTPEQYHVSRSDIFQMITKVGTEEMKDGNNNWHNQICNTFQCYLGRPGPLNASDSQYVRSCIQFANDRAKERMTNLINTLLFPDKIMVTEKKILEKVIIEKKIEDKIIEKKIDVKSDEKKKPKGRKKIPSALRFAVWNEFAKGNEICFCCKRESITVANFECGHIVAVKNGGEDKIQNLRPICSQCNRSMGTKNMNDFIAQCGF